MTETIRLATRGSDLALRQTQSVADALESRRRSVELVEVDTEGDRVRDELIHRLGRTGAFVRALDERVVDGTVDAAVHSMKDMPTEFPEDLVVAGVPERAAAGDLLVSPDGSTLEELPSGATVGTSSLRRKAQLLAARPDLEVRPLRGNVDTRLEKLLAPTLQAEHERRLESGDGGGGSSDDSADDAGDGTTDEPGDDGGDGTTDGSNEGSSDGAKSDGLTAEEWFDGLSELERGALERDVDDRYDAIVLAEAGLARSGLLDEVAFERLPASFVPAPGQGALAVTARDGDLAASLRRDLDHPRTRVETTVERTVLATLGGGCVAPIGVHAVLQGAYVHTTVRVLAQDGTDEVAATRDLPVERHPEAAGDLADQLAAEGAADLVDRAREEAR